MLRVRSHTVTSSPQILRPLERVRKEMEPLETLLAEARAKYEETENEVFGSQIRPLEARLCACVCECVCVYYMCVYTVCVCVYCVCVCL